MKTTKPKRPNALQRRITWEREMRALSGVFIPMKLPNPLNTRVHWSIKQQQRFRTKEYLFDAFGRRSCYPPAIVTLTRYGPRKMDDDGLSASLKHVRDGVADYLGVDDGDTAAVRFVCRQELAPWPGVRIVIKPMN